MKSLGRAIRAGLIILLLAGGSFGEHRFRSGPYSGFTKLEPERVIVELPKPLHVREVSGVLLAGDQHEPVRKALFELRDDDTGKIKAAKTDNEGRFHIKHVKDGRYTFKATRKGYQSVVGVLVVREKLQQPEPVTINMSKALQAESPSGRVK
jgi:hypothetical protein